MKKSKTCPYCKSRKTENNYDGTMRCKNCKKTSGGGQKKITGEGAMTLFLIFYLLFIIFVNWLELVNRFLEKNIIIYIGGIILISIFGTKAIINTYKKHSK